MPVLPFDRHNQKDAPHTAPAVPYRGSGVRAAKAFFAGTHRTVSPCETLERIRPYFDVIGITRLANITGLDRIGVPVTLAVRPNGRVLSNAAGKGLTLEAANVSAAMEAIETYHAENVRLPVLRQPYESVRKERITVPIEELPRARHAVRSGRFPERWVLGWDLIGQQEVAVPLELVSLVAEPGWTSAWWTVQGGSNGLASGNHVLEAICAGLFELIERDALACYLVAWERTGRPMPRLRPETVRWPLVRDLLARLAAARVGPVIFDCTLDTGVPVYLVYLYDREHRHVGIFRGSGAHLDPEVALVRALTEAIQSRAVYVAGSRDDLLRRGLLALQLHDDARAVELLESVPPTMDARERTPEATPTFEGDVQLILGKLRSVGLNQVVVVELTHPGFEVSVVRVIVPVLDGYRSERTAPGRRARTFAAGGRP